MSRPVTGPFYHSDGKPWGESPEDICDKYCGRADCYVGSEDDVGPEKFRCMKSTAPARIIK